MRDVRTLQVALPHARNTNADKCEWNFERVVSLHGDVECGARHETKTCLSNASTQLEYKSMKQPPQLYVTRPSGVA